MKRWIVFLILAAVLLSGCASDGSLGSATEPTEQTVDPVPGLYIPNSDIETQTNGAVRQYGLEHNGFCTMDFMGSDVLLFFNQQDGVLVNRLEGTNCAVAASGMLPAGIYPNGASVRVEGRMLAYYSSEDNSVVYLNDTLRETSRRKLLHEVTSIPALGRDLYSVYYNVGTEVYTADLHAGIARLIRQYDGQSPAVQQTLFHDSMLLCAETAFDGSVTAAFISSVNGSPVGVDTTLSRIETTNSDYLLQRKDGAVDEVLFGALDKQTKLLLPKEDGKLHFAIAKHGAVVESTLENGDILLSFYDLSTGKRTAEVTLRSLSQVLAVAADEDGNYIWIVADDGNGKQTLLRWNVRSSKVEDAEAYSRQRYTLENPDIEGIKECQTLADEISQRHGVNISLVDDVKQPEDYVLRYEYQVEPIKQGLAKLDAALSKFPEGFLSAMHAITGEKGIHIGLVRGVVIDAKKGATEPEGLQYWLEGEAYIAISLGYDIERAVIHEISHVLDSYIFANSVLYDEWEQVNPEGFQYDENYMDYLDRTDSAYLREDNRCFIDAYSMTFAKEDRARILEYALTEGNEAYFNSTVMQNKLQRICKAIRDAYGWKKDPGTFPWEQYLRDSLAYVEKK